MAEILLGGVTVDACTSCLATWFDAGELSDFLHMAKDVPGAKFHSRTSRFRCPRCAGGGMREFAFVNAFNLLVDRCESCGGGVFGAW